jgi:type VI protein secretion system component Hcp
MSASRPGVDLPRCNARQLTVVLVTPNESQPASPRPGAKLISCEVIPLAQLDAFMILKDHAGKPVPGETIDEEMSKQKAISITHFTLSGEFSDTSTDKPADTTKTDKVPKTKKGQGTKKLILSVTKNLDSSSPHLMVAYCYHLQTSLTEIKPFQELKIIVRKAGDTGTVKHERLAQAQYLELTFTHVYLASYTCGGQHKSNDDLPVESLTFRFKQVSMKYWPQEATGRISSSMKPMEWNFY